MIAKLVKTRMTLVTMLTMEKKMRIVKRSKRTEKIGLRTGNRRWRN